MRQMIVPKLAQAASTQNQQQLAAGIQILGASLAQPMKLVFIGIYRKSSNAYSKLLSWEFFSSRQKAEKIVVINLK